MRSLRPGQKRRGARTAAARRRRDPAPSRLAYRLHRLWLTPLFRGFIRIGLPVVLILGGGLHYLSDDARRENLQAWLAEQRRAFEERPEFMVRLMAIDGASPELAEDIREAVPIDFPVSQFDLDLEHIRGTVAGLDAVAQADVSLRAQGVLQISVRQRLPVVVWRARREIALLDETGHRVAAVIARAARPDLPLIAGDGADRAVPEALALMAAARPLKDRLRGLVRMGERRWDLVLDRNQRILLPEEDPVPALERVLVLDAARDLLARDITVIDMRLPARPTLRMGPGAREAFRMINLFELEEGAVGQ